MHEQPEAMLKRLKQVVLRGHLIVVSAITYSEMRFGATGPKDTAIAGHAIAAGTILVTNNARKFERVPGLTLEDWGAEMGYPGIVLDDTGNRVHGFLFSSEDLHNHWYTLDEFEGSEYERVPVEVTISTGQTVRSFIYMLRS